MTNQSGKKWVIRVIILVIVMAGIGYQLQQLQQPEIAAGIASGNGRIEATEVDITTRYGGRLARVLAKEGESVELNQALAEFDTREMDAQLRRAEAEVRRAQQERNVAAAIIEQRKSELSLAQKNLQRAKGLYENDSISLEQLHHDETAVQTGKATLAAARAQLSNAEAAIESAIANSELIKVQIDDSTLKSPIAGRVLYRLAEPGEVLPAGGKVLTVLDPVDVYMTVFLPTQQAARLAIGAEARLLLDGIPDQVLPTRVSFVAPRAQFTPKEVETRAERENLMFRIKTRLNPDFLRQHIEMSKTGVPGMAFIRLEADAAWPDQVAQVSMP